MSKPTQIGYYWARFGGGRWEMTFYSDFQWFADQPGVWYRFADLIAERIRPSEVSEWRGPLLPPSEEPKP